MTFDKMPGEMPATMGNFACKSTLLTAPMRKSGFYGRGLDELVGSSNHARGEMFSQLSAQQKRWLRPRKARGLYANRVPCKGKAKDALPAPSRIWLIKGLHFSMNL